MPARRPRARRTVARRIQFYRADAGRRDDGQPIPLDPRPCLEQLETLEGDAAYLVDSSGDAVRSWVDRSVPNQRLRLARVRRSGLPQVERAGLLTRLPIPQDAGLAEQVHVVFFADGIVGADFNFYGPRLGRLSQLLWVRANCRNVSFRVLLKRDASAELDNFGEVRLLTLRIRADYADSVAQADRDLGSAFRASRRAAAAEEIELTVKRAPYSHESLAHSLLATVRRLARRNDIREGASRFVVRGEDRETGEVTQIDLLRDKLGLEKDVQIEEGNTRALVAESVYAAIDEAHHELRDEFEGAATLEE